MSQFIAFKTVSTKAIIGFKGSNPVMFIKKERFVDNMEVKKLNPLNIEMFDHEFLSEGKELAPLTQTFAKMSFSSIACVGDKTLYQVETSTNADFKLKIICNLSLNKKDRKCIFYLEGRTIFKLVPVKDGGYKTQILGGVPPNGKLCLYCFNKDTYIAHCLEGTVKKSNGKKTQGKKSNRKKTQGKKSNGKKTQGKKSNGKKTQGKKARKAQTPKVQTPNGQTPIPKQKPLPKAWMSGSDSETEIVIEDVESVQ